MQVSKEFPKMSMLAKMQHGLNHWFLRNLNKTNNKSNQSN